MKIFLRLNIQLRNLNYMMIQQIKYILHKKYNSNYISNSNYVFMNNTFFYNLNINLKVVISFRMTEVNIVKIWYESINTDRMIIKHYGN